MLRLCKTGHTILTFGAQSWQRCDMKVIVLTDVTTWTATHRRFFKMRLTFSASNSNFVGKIKKFVHTIYHSLQWYNNIFYNDAFCTLSKRGPTQRVSGSTAIRENFQISLWIDGFSFKHRCNFHDWQFPYVIYFARC